MASRDSHHRGPTRETTIVDIMADFHSIKVDLVMTVYIMCLWWSATLINSLYSLRVLLSLRLWVQKNDVHIIE
jgi:hypothetical protein